MSVHPPLLIRPPTLRTSERERSSSWLELFFDLVFVVAITQLGLSLAADVSLRGYARFGLLFAPVWWAWVGYTNYADRFDSDDVAFRLVMLGAMFGIAVVAVAIPDTFGHRSTVFAGAYAAVRALLIVLYARARRHVTEARTLCDVTMRVFILGTGLWLVSLAVPEPWRFLLWGVALLVEGATPWVARRAMASLPYHASHLPERYGLFTLIVLGESLVAVVVGIHNTNWRPVSIMIAACGFVCVAASWWLYFDSIDRGTVRQSLVARNTFIYGHLFIALGLTMAGVGVKQGILHASTSRLSAGGRWALCGGVAMFLLALALIRSAAMHGVRDRLFLTRAGACGVIVLVGALGATASPAVVMGAVTALLLSAVIVDVVLHARMEAAPELAGTGEDKGAGADSAAEDRTGAPAEWA